MNHLPEFEQMSKQVKEELTRRFRPDFCPNCGREITSWTSGLNVQEIISSVPCWNIGCQFCGVEYQVRIVTP